MLVPTTSATACSAALRKSGWNPDEPPYMFERLEAYDAVIGGVGMVPPLTPNRESAGSVNRSEIIGSEMAAVTHRTPSSTHASELPPMAIIDGRRQRS